MTDAEREAFAEALIEARATGRPFDPGDRVPRDRHDAYAIQSGVALSLGPIGGFKTASRPDEAPIMAPILLRDIHPAGVSIPVTDRMGVELEVGFRILAQPSAVPDDAELRRCVEPVVVVELVGTRITGDAAGDPFVKLADNQVNYGLVIGDTAADWDGRDFGCVGASMRIGETELIDDTALVPGGSAFGALRNLLGIVGNHCGGLLPGMTVITGSLHPLTYVRSGTRVSGRIDGIGTVELDLPPAS